MKRVEKSASRRRRGLTVKLLHRFILYSMKDFIDYFSNSLHRKHLYTADDRCIRGKTRNIWGEHFLGTWNYYMIFLDIMATHIAVIN